jgi:hypothetical protein
LPITSSVDPDKRLDRALPKEIEIDPRLARINRAWSMLPAPIQRAMEALVDTALPTL